MHAAKTEARATSRAGRRSARCAKGIEDTTDRHWTTAGTKNTAESDMGITRLAGSNVHGFAATKHANTKTPIEASHATASAKVTHAQAFANAAARASKSSNSPGRVRGQSATHIPTKGARHAARWASRHSRHAMPSAMDAGTPNRQNARRSRTSYLSRVSVGSVGSVNSTKRTASAIGVGCVSELHNELE